MFRRTQQRPEPDAIEVVIGPRASFSGTLQCDASIRIDGVVEQGQIVTAANVILTESANVQCDIVAKTVSIRGHFRGIIQADRVEMLDASQVYGALNVNSFYMDDQAVLRATVNIRGDALEGLTGPADTSPECHSRRQFRNGWGNQSRQLGGTANCRMACSRRPEIRIGSWSALCTGPIILTFLVPYEVSGKTNIAFSKCKIGHDYE